MPSSLVSVPAAARSASSAGSVVAHDVARPQERLGLEPGVVGPVETVHDAIERFLRRHPAEGTAGVSRQQVVVTADPAVERAEPSASTTVPTARMTIMMAIIAG